MASVFTKILDRELPARFVYEDETCAAFLTIAPVRPGHTLVIPRLEIDSWLDLPPDVSAHLFEVSAVVGRAVARAFRPRRVAAALLGLEVPHVHVHLIPIDRESDVDFARADHNPDPAAMDDAQARIRAALAEGA